MGKKENLENYIKYNKWMNDNLKLAIEMFKQELKTNLSQETINQILIEDYKKTEIIIGFEFNEVMKENIELNAKINAKINIQNLTGEEIKKLFYIPLAKIDLETETITIYKLDEVETYVKHVYSEYTKTLQEYINERYKLNLYKHEKNIFYNLFNRTEKKIDKISGEIMFTEYCQKEIEKNKIFFLEQNKNFINNTFKEEFENCFGIKLVVKGE